ncbi:hypothetical protein CI109_105321 [Kwoniella shandongensis]|uniref:Uncharacterized protein n=1 Tax=Kwoniella shandongensis TaxID=1734106 RepID=A0A5M6BUS3_9TREE|nr:uncharacterized protein CI109_005004 [Kwoniella shandongensis]KAA5526614.1 hypothetical protein CI109_005004 [Kwoniella shandongensis]
MANDPFYHFSPFDLEHELDLNFTLYERRKRTASTSEKQPRNGHGKKAPSSAGSGSSRREDLSEKAAGKQREDDGRPNGIGSKAPSLNVDIRNSLILPSLSQRFSVLIPSLSTAPEESLRSLLASQRARHNGPALTEEEEELLFAEIRGTSAGQNDDWDGQPPTVDQGWSYGAQQSNGYQHGIPPSATAKSFLTTSVSSPSILASSDDGKATSPTSAGNSSSWSATPPPTSSSFTSFQTFGVGADGDSPVSAASANVKTKSYGFSGGSGMRDGDYIRRVKKSASHKNLKGSVSSRKSNKSDDSESTPTKENVPLPPIISPEKANACYQTTKQPLTARSASPATSERTATPTSTLVASVFPLPPSKPGHSPSSSLSLKSRRHGHSPSSSLSLRSHGHSPSSSVSLKSPYPPPTSLPPPTPDSPNSPSFPGHRRKSQRKSLLAGLSQAQVKRISLALEEIGGELKRGNSVVKRDVQMPAQLNGLDEEEEMLEPERPDIEDNGGKDHGRPRRPSDMRSEGSAHSATSSVFPFQMSPTNSTFTGNPSTAPNSPTKLPPSPRSHNLLAHVEDPLPPIPQPIFTPMSKPLDDSPPPTPVPVMTPTRSLPVKHQPSLSTSSSHSQVLPNPVYIPGQPRPVRSMHHSEGSISSRAPTPVNQSPLDALRAAAASPDRLMRESTSSPLGGMPNITARTTSLARSRSVNQTSTTPSKPGSADRGDGPPSSFTRRRAGTVGEMTRRLSSPMANHSPNPDTIEEGDETSDQEDYENQSSNDHPPPQLKQLPARHSVADSRRESEASVHQLRHNNSGRRSPYKDRAERAVSIQGTILSSEEGTPASTAPNSASMSPSVTLEKQPSINSLSSNYVEAAVTEIQWINVFDSNGQHSMDLEQPASPTAAADMLRKLSGVGIQEMAILQGKLVEKAKLEREALRGEMGDSPIVPYTPTMSVETFSPASQRPLSPPAKPTSPLSNTWRFPTTSMSPPIRASQETYQNASSVDTHILTPPLAGPLVARSGSRSGAVVIPLRPAPAPPVHKPSVDTPSEANDEVVYTPPSGNLSRKASTGATGRLPPAEDPEIRRDFEARIAAATAALNRTPSTQGGKLGRNATKRGPMVISSPTLVSSTANLPTTPLTPENGLDPALAKSLEKTSGSASKMSLRWRKLAGLRKSPSVSNNETSPFSATAASSPSPVHTQPQPQPKPVPIQSAGLQRAQSTSAARKLDEPIALRPSEEMAAAPPSAPPHLDSFKFPSSAQRPVSPTPQRIDLVNVPPQPSGSAPTGIRQMMTKLKRREGTPEDSVPSPPEAKPADLISMPQRPERPAAQTTTSSTALASNNAARLDQSTRPSAPSDDPAILKFVEAGRQLGLNEEQIKDMLAAKGMAAQSETTASSQSNYSTTPTSVSTTHITTAPALPTLPKPAPGEKEKEKKGLFRSLSRSKKAQPALAPAPALIPTPAATLAAEPLHDKVAVRRTLILPDGLMIVPSTPQTSSTPKPSDSPDASARLGPQRKQSIRRKPINLSKEDQELVQSSPPAHRSSFSRSDVSSGDAIHGLGFLHPNSTMGMGDTLRTTSNVSVSGSPSGSADDRSFTDSHQRSSTGGSLIDMYADGDDDEEVLQASPVKDTAEAGDGRRPSTQALEICEYADGQVVWNIVDALRTSVSGSLDGEEYGFDAAHSRSTSYASSRRDSSAPGEGGDVFAAGWPKGGGIGVPGLNLRHRDRNNVPKPRPPTDVYFTSSRDVADLIDHLSRDLDASHGRIDILPTNSPSTGLRGDPSTTNSSSSPFMYHDSADHAPSSPSPTNAQFEDAPSPAPPPRRAPPPAPISPRRANAMTGSVPAGGFSPKRQMFVKQNMLGQGFGSPSAASFASSSTSGGPGGKTVEDRLQALLDKLKGDGAGY